MTVKCYNCFRDYDDKSTSCPHCGHCPADSRRLPNHLPAGVVMENRYIIGEVCGFGGFGITYKSWDMQLDTIVAIKEYFPNKYVNRIPGTKEVLPASKSLITRKEFSAGLKRFIAEAKMMAKYVSHHNIVNVFKYFEENGTAYIVMEFLDGISLDTKLEQLKKEEKYMDTEQALEITLSMCDALKTIHADGVIHRDISPDNIYLCRNGTYKLFDFGAARFAQAENLMLTIILKAGYAPPEQYEKVNEQGPWTDIYALGATLYKMLTNVRPDESTDRQKKDNLPEPITLNSGIPRYLNDAVMKAMAVQQRFRFQTVEEFEAVLKQEKPVEAVKTTVKKLRWKLLASLCAAGAVLAAAAGIVAFRLEQQRQMVTLPDGAIEVWYIADDDTMTDALAEIRQEFCASYENVSVELVGIPAEDYAQRLSEARNAGTMPALFQSDGIDTENLPVLSVDSVFSELELENYEFLKENKEQILNGQKLPLGFQVSVFYLSSKCGYTGTSVKKISDVIGADGRLSIASGMEDIFAEWFPDSTYVSVAPEEFYSGNAEVFFSDTASLFTIRQALPGQFRIAAVGTQNVPCRFSSCWSLGDCGNSAGNKIADRFLKVMFSDHSQDILYLLHTTDALPLSKAVLAAYTEVYAEFEPLTEDMENYVFELP